MIAANMGYLHGRGRSGCQALPIQHLTDVLRSLCPAVLPCGRQHSHRLGTPQSSKQIEAPPSGELLFCRGGPQGEKINNINQYITVYDG